MMEVPRSVAATFRALPRVDGHATWQGKLVPEGELAADDLNQVLLALDPSHHNLLERYFPSAQHISCGGPIRSSLRSGQGSEFLALLFTGACQASA